MTNIPINPNPAGFVAPTPQNTPLNAAPITTAMSRPTVPDISEDNEAGDDDDEEDPTSGMSNSMHAAMMGLVGGKLAGLVGKSSGYIESLPVEVKRSVEALKGVQVKQTELQNQYKRECLELEKKYLELQKPLYERRSAIIAGTAKPTVEEIEAGEKSAIKDDPEYTPIEKGEETAAIPEFWLTALRNHMGLTELITERDEAALKHLTDVSIIYLDSSSDKPGFKLIFKFSPNDFFENEELIKTYVYQEEVGYSGDFVYDRAIGTEIKWKEDKDLTKEIEIKKQRNKTTNRTRLVRKAHPTESFFNFFDPPTPPSEDAIENGDIDDDELEEIEEKLEMDYQIGEDFKEKIIPRAIDYFTGKALEYECLSDSDSDFDGMDDDDEDGFDEEESDSEPEVPARRRGPPKARGGAANTNPEECKQQ